MYSEETVRHIEQRYEQELRTERDRKARVHAVIRSVADAQGEVQHMQNVLRVVETANGLVIFIA